MIGVLVRGGGDMEKQHEEEMATGRQRWRLESRSHSTQRQRNPEAAKGWTDFPLEPAEGARPADTSS